MWHVACGMRKEEWNTETEDGNHGRWKMELVKDSLFQPMTQLKKAALSNLSSSRSSRSISISKISLQDAAALFHRAPRSTPDRVTVFQPQAPRRGCEC